MTHYYSSANGWAAAIPVIAGIHYSGHHHWETTQNTQLVDFGALYHRPPEIDSNRLLLKNNDAHSRASQQSLWCLLYVRCSEVFSRLIKVNYVVWIICLPNFLLGATWRESHRNRCSTSMRWRHCINISSWKYTSQVRSKRTIYVVIFNVDRFADKNRAGKPLVPPRGYPVTSDSSLFIYGHPSLNLLRCDGLRARHSPVKATKTLGDWSHVCFYYALSGNRFESGVNGPAAKTCRHLVEVPTERWLCAIKSTWKYSLPPQQNFADGTTRREAGSNKASWMGGSRQAELGEMRWRKERLGILSNLRFDPITNIGRLNILEVFEHQELL